ncbi:MAG: [protein-PII] uridylyltransferase [Conchiformibius sp.]|nr:[protein-PII] uridylyltransferase [Conchiformibius sp.]
MNENWQTFLQQGREQAAAAYRRHRRPHRFFRDYTAVLETVLRAVWADCFNGSGLCLLAVGGFGRGEVYPYSDTDLAVVSRHSLDERQQAQLAQFVQTLWDCGLNPAVKAGSLNELADAACADLTADTAFLEARFLCGDRALAAEFTALTDARRDVWHFTEGKLLEMRRRHRKQPALALEPDLKNGIGGLRDIHTMLWLAKAQGIAAGFQQMVRQNVITRLEAGLLLHSHRQLAALRIGLHLAAGRAEEKLRFDLQAAVADGQGSEALMAAFYRAAKTVLQLNGILLPMLRGRLCSDWPRITADWDAHYYLVDNHIAVKDLQLFFRQPEHLFAVLEIWQSGHGVQGMAPKTLRAWWMAAAQLPAGSLYAEPANRRRFLGFFQRGQGLTAVMRHLNLYGVLAQYLPEWNKIVGLLQHDLFHIYPVDDHILTVLANLRRLAAEQHAHELPFASALMRGFERKDILYLAALFHDIAKGRNGDHAVLGVADARRFAADHGLPPDDAELLAWLVEAHLDMSQTAQKEDFQDETVLARFCERVGTRERLTALYLLTVADIRGTNPDIWNSWKAQLLERLFQAAARRLSGQDAPQDDGLPENVDAKTLRRLRSALGEAYFARHTPQETAWHLSLLAADWETPQVAARRWADGDTLQVMVFMPNGARLFTRLCRIFSRHHLDIADAKAFISAHNYILDTFAVRFPENHTDADAARLQAAVTAELEAFLHGSFRESSDKPRLSRRARYLPIAPYIGLMPAAGGAGWYALEVVAANRSGLLADITEVFAAHGISLKHAKISTLADRVEDNFLIYAPQLAEPAAELALKHDLTAVLA